MGQWLIKADITVKHSITIVMDGDTEDEAVNRLYDLSFDALEDCIDCTVMQEYDVEDVQNNDDEEDEEDDE